ncbi:MAG: hypothetical protein GX825_06625, partial [Syntrophomonadaceae bacterium]|nr:hypothetical protein [Syntrophomonadaceae bacterium]
MRFKIITILTLVLLTLGLTACSVEQSNNGNNLNQQKDTRGSNSSTSGNGQNPLEDIVRDRAAEVIVSIKAKDMEALSRAVHPDKGV